MSIAMLAMPLGMSIAISIAISNKAIQVFWKIIKPKNPKRKNQNRFFMYMPPPC
jgi:hypothetical protein